MKLAPREIEVHIEELVLQGFDPTSRSVVGDALGNELLTLLAQRGVPPAWHASPARIAVGSFPTYAQMKPMTAGEQIARAVYEGGRQ